MKIVDDETIKDKMIKDKEKVEDGECDTATKKQRGKNRV